MNLDNSPALFVIPLIQPGVTCIGIDDSWLLMFLTCFFRHIDTSIVSENADVALGTRPLQGQPHLHEDVAIWMLQYKDTKTVPLYKAVAHNWKLTQANMITAMITSAGLKYLMKLN